MLIEFNSNFLGDDHLRHRVVFERGSLMNCIYCSLEATTREHVPSKVFLSKPLPSTLGMLPACKKCNNNFSTDEVKVYLMIQLAKLIFDGISLNDKAKRLIEKYPVIAEELKEKLLKCDKYEFEEEFITIVSRKLLVGHLIFEFTEGFDFNEYFSELNLWYGFIPSFDDEERDELDIDSCLVLENEFLPEVGSRIYDKYRVATVALKNEETSEVSNISMLVLDWIEIQEETYRYLVFYKGDYRIVRIIIDEYFFIEAIFEIKESLN